MEGNKGKLVTRRSQSSTIAPRYRIQDSLGFWIPFHLFYSGFRVLDSSLFQWNLDSRFHSLVGCLSSILDSKALDSGFRIKIFPDSGSYKQKFSSQTFSDLFTHI